MNNRGLISALPAPPRDLSGWPWTEECSPAKYAAQPEDYWPKISIVCPSYGQALFIEATIRSVLLQNYPQLELIVMDGGSTDGTVEILNKYTPWITYWQSCPDRGQTHALNSGFEKTKGELLGWINSDDYYLPESFFTIAQNHRLWPKNLLFGDWQELTETGEIIVHQERPAFAFEVTAGARHLPSHATFWPRQGHVPLNEQLRFTMDADLFKRIVRSGFRPKYIPRPLGVFRKHPASKTSTIIDVAREESDAHARAQPWHIHYQWRFARLLDRIRCIIMRFSTSSG